MTGCRAPGRCHTRLLAWGRAHVGEISDRDLLIAGTALYAGDGAKTDGSVTFTNTNPQMIALYCRWLRRFFDIDESRLRVRLYLHEGLSEAAAVTHWAEVTGIPPRQFHKSHRAVADDGIRHSKHVDGCAAVVYSSKPVHRRIMGLVQALVAE